MIKTCFFRSCKEKVTSFCKCLEKPIFCCDTHLCNHIKENNSHSVINLILELDNNEQASILEKKHKGIDFLRCMKKDLLKFSNIMIENIFKLTKQSISKINELKIGFRKILDEVVSFSIIDKDNYKQIENMSTTHQFFKNHENVIECLKKTFEFNIFTPIEINNDSNSNDLFFSKISESRGL